MKYTNLDITNQDDRRRLINGLVNSVWLFEDGIICFYNSEPTRPLNLDELKEELKKRNINFDNLVDGSFFKGLGGDGWT